MLQCNPYKGGQRCFAKAFDDLKCISTALSCGHLVCCKDRAKGRRPWPLAPAVPAAQAPFWSGAQVEAAGLRRLARRLAPVPVVPARLPRGGAMCGARPAEKRPPVAGVDGRASDPPRRAFVRRLETVMWRENAVHVEALAGHDGRGKRSRKPSRRQTSRRRARATTSSERASSAGRSPAHSNPPLG